jgi:hypothetical protein
MPENSTGQTEQWAPDILDPREIFRYRATIRLATETATFEFNPEIPLPARRAMLLKDPGWRMPWPPRLTADAGRDDLILAFSKIAGALGMRAGIPGSTAVEIRSGVYEIFRTVPQAIEAGDSGFYRRFVVEASVQDDCSASWEYFEDRPGLAVPGTEDDSQHLGKPGVEVFVQNLLRTDILERLEELQDPNRSSQSKQ